VAQVEAKTGLLSDRASPAEAGGDAEQLFAVVYDELHALAERFMHAERKDHTLQPTAIVNEAYLRLVGQKRVVWAGREHFFAVAATMIRRILVEHARKRNAAKRGGGGRKVPLDAHPTAEDDRSVDLLTLDEGLAELGRLNERQARIVELRFFGGLNVEATARVLGVCPRTVKGEWRVARAWLRSYLSR
jgi:RNA polymerase sigma factor (TIGR02999 family)